jgi:pheromone shutdown protein TraB
VEVKIGIVKIKNQLNAILLLVNAGHNHGMLHFLKNVKPLAPFVLEFGLKNFEQISTYYSFLYIL